MQLSQRSLCLLLQLVLFLTALAPSALGAPDKIFIEPREQWTNVFGGKEVTFHFVVKGSRAIKGRAGWTFFLMPNRASVAAGETEIKAGTFEVRVRVPETKPGAIQEAGLSINVEGEDGKPIAAGSARRLWIFPADPFADRQQWLKDLKITLFDPQKTTAEKFAKMKIPFEETNNIAAFTEIKQGLLIVGEGVSFKDYPDLAETMVKTAADGLPVLCLAPSEGTLSLPGGDARLPIPGTLSFARQEKIADLDKRLDAQGWPPDGKVTASALVLKADSNAVIGEVSKETQGWPWFEADYPDKKSKLVICGFGLLGKAWDEGPTPRFLLARILETMTPNSDRSIHEKENER